MILVLIGFFAAMLAGLGLGGGVLLIPALVLLCGIDQSNAQMYSLLTYIPIAVSALTVHLRAHNINWKCLLLLLPFGIAGAICGSLLAGSLPVALLKKAYGIFLLVFGIIQGTDILKGRRSNQIKK